jgi:hypothetical protein
MAMISMAADDADAFRSFVSEVQAAAAGVKLYDPQGNLIGGDRD